MADSNFFQNVEFMRKVDYWIGVPICWFLDCFYFVGKLFRKYRFKNPENILFIELSEMGSTVLAYSAMIKVKELYPNANLYFMIFKKNADSVRALNIMNESNIITIDDRNIFAFKISTFKALIKCWNKKIDTVIDLELFSRFTAILTYLSKARNRVGFYRFTMEGLYRGNMLTHKVSYNPHQHISKSFLAMVYALQAPRDQYPLIKKHISESEVIIPRIESSKEAKEMILNKIFSFNKNLNRDRKKIIINPNAGLLAIRAWPLENYIHLCKKLINDSASIIVTGVGEAEKDANAILSAAGNENCISLVNKTSFLELIDLYNCCDIIITNDSGPVHFAALTPIKIIAFYGPETHKLYGPIGKNITIINSEYACSPCLSAFNHRKSPCSDNQCLKTISVEEVYEVVKRIF